MNNLTCHYKGINYPKKFIGFKGLLIFYRSVKEGYITVEQQKEQKNNKNDLNCHYTK